VVRTVMHLGGVGALHGGDGVAGVDRALEGVGADHLGDVADLRHVQQAATRGATFLPLAVAGTGCGCSQRRDGQHLGGHVLGQAVGQRGAVGVQHLGHAGDLRGGLRGGAGVVAGHQHMHLAAAGQRR
jgi:hypothetical protein